MAWRVTLALMLGLLSVGCASDKKIIAQANTSHTQLAPAIIRESDLQKYVQGIGDRIVRSAQQYDAEEGKSSDNAWMFENIEFHLVNSDTLNAFTTGGTHVYLYRALFNQAKSEDEFAAVVAHEFGHIYGRHVQKGTNRQYALLGGAAVAAVGGAAIAGKDNYLTGAAIGGAAGLAVGQFAGMGFTRGDEHEADNLGFEFYVRAGYDPQKFKDFFQQMIDKGYDTTPAMASDHPTLKSRVENANELVSKLPPESSKYRSAPIADIRNFKNYQGEALAAAKNLPNDKSLGAAMMLLDAFPSCVAPKDQPRQVAAREKIVEAAAKK